MGSNIFVDQQQYADYLKNGTLPPGGASAGQVQDFNPALQIGGGAVGGDVGSSSAVSGGSPLASGPSYQVDSPAESLSGPTAAQVPGQGIQQQILSPLQQGLQQGRAQLQGSTGRFYNEAGRTPDFGAVQTQLQSAIQPGGDPDVAHNFLSNTYQGPSELGGLGDVYRTVEEALPRAQSAQSFGQLPGLIRQSAPGLTPGESRYEASLLRQQPGFFDEARRFSQQLRGLSSQTESAQQQARQFAEERRAGASEIGAQSRDYLQERGGDITSALNSLVQSRTKEQERAGAGFQEFLEAGDIAPLLAAGDVISFDDPSGERLSPEVLSELLEGGPLRTKIDASKDALRVFLETYPELQGMRLEQNLYRPTENPLTSDFSYRFVDPQTGERVEVIGPSQPQHLGTSLGVSGLLADSPWGPGRTGLGTTLSEPGEDIAVRRLLDLFGVQGLVDAAAFEPLVKRGGGFGETEHIGGKHSGRGSIFFGGSEFGDVLPLHGTSGPIDGSTQSQNLFLLGQYLPLGTGSSFPQSALATGLGGELRPMNLAGEALENITAAELEYEPWTRTHDLTPVDYTDVRPFSSFVPGVLPTVENQAVKEQRDKYNLIQSLLGSEKELLPAQVPYDDMTVILDEMGIRRADLKTLDRLAAEQNLIGQNMGAVAYSLANPWGGFLGGRELGQPFTTDIPDLGITAPAINTPWPFPQRGGYSNAPINEEYIPQPYVPRPDLIPVPPGFRPATANSPTVGVRG